MGEGPGQKQYKTSTGHLEESMTYSSLLGRIFLWNLGLFQKWKRIEHFLTHIMKPAYSDPNQIKTLQAKEKKEQIRSDQSLSRVQLFVTP